VSKALRLNTFGGLWIESPEGGSAADVRPRGLALLAILAAGGAKGMTRDRVLGVLWPDTEEERARHALSQTIYGLRRDLGEDLIDSTPALRLDPSLISSDVADFQAAVKAREWEKAAAQYHGPFLDGFYLADAPEFERWVETERASLATAGIRAIEIVAKSSTEAGRPEEAAEHWHRLARLDPLDSRIAASYMEALAALGDRAAAIAHGRAHAELRRRELEVGPDPIVERVVERLREATDLPAGGRVPGSALPPAGPDVEAVRPTRLIPGPRPIPSAGSRRTDGRDRGEPGRRRHRRRARVARYECEPRGASTSPGGRPDSRPGSSRLRGPRRVVERDARHEPRTARRGAGDRQLAHAGAHPAGR
jgi:DNA-binding SARP family transcriptional activator